MLSHQSQTSFKNSHLFKSLTEKQLNQVYRNSHVSDLKEGTQLFSQGDEVNCFYLVLSGSIKLFRLSPDGNEKVVEIIEAGETFAEALMFRDQPHYPVSATALGPSKVVSINNNNFKAMLHESVDTCFLLMAAMSTRLHSLIQEIDTLSLNTGTMRIANYLLEHAPADDNQFELKIPKSVIASRLSVKPETFSRVLKHLHELDILTIHGREVTIHDREAMAAIAAG